MIGELIERLFLAALGLGWFAYNAHKLGEWLKIGREKSRVVFWIMVPYRTGCMIFGLLWMSYTLVADLPRTDPVTGEVAPKSAKAS